MVSGVGIDLVEKSRVQKAIEREGFLKRVYTQKEQELIAVRPTRAASNFAAKEAVAKALGCGFLGIRPDEIEVLRHPSGQPYVVLHGAAREKAEALGVERIFISITDTAELARAAAVLEGRRLEGSAVALEGQQPEGSTAAPEGWRPEGSAAVPEGRRSEGSAAASEGWRSEGSAAVPEEWRLEGSTAAWEGRTDGTTILAQLTGRKDNEERKEEYLPVLTAAGAKEVDDLTMTEYGIPSLLLMERAAQAVRDRVLCYATKQSVTGILCGTGNNGGDGLAVARQLVKAGYQVKVFLKNAEKWKELWEEKKNSQEKPSGTEEFLQQYVLAQKAGVLFFDLTEMVDCDLFVDALFGIGLTREITGDYEEAICKINAWQRTVIAVDIASGISADTGAVCGVAVRATETVTFGAAKCGHLFYPGKEYTGKLWIEDIGFPKALLWEKQEGFYFKKGYLPKRPEYSNKGTFGKVAVLAGSKNMAGAAYFCAYAAYRSGAGLVKIVTPECNREILQTKLPEAMLTTYGGNDDTGKQAASGNDDTGKRAASGNDDTEKWAASGKGGSGIEAGTTDERNVCAAAGTDGKNGDCTVAGAVAEAVCFADALVIGPGIGKSALSKKLVQETAEALKRLGEKAPLSVWDADALNLLAEEMDAEGCRKIEERRDFLAGKLPQNAVLTPHPGELSRLTGIPAAELVRQLMKIAGVLTKGNTLTFVVKDAVTVVAQGMEKFVQTAGNSGMATGGSGDVLTGVIAALAAGKMPEMGKMLEAGKMPETAKMPEAVKMPEAGKLSAASKTAASFWAAVHGVWLHGLAGDAAAGLLGEAPVMASDIAYALATLRTQKAEEKKD